MEKKQHIQALMLLSLGYMVDFFDLTLFAAARGQILSSFHINPDNTLHVSYLMFNSQAIGIVLGGLLAGMWGDKIGRMSSIRLGILLYSSAILLSVFTTSIDVFIFLRFLAGLGLAGELASSVTFITESTEGRRRDIGVSIIYFSGVIGGILATVLSAFVGWKTLFLIGAIAGFLLLFFRMSLKDPILFYTIKKNTDIRKGSLRILFLKKDSLVRVLSLTILLIPFWFMVYFINFGPEIARQIGIVEVPLQSIILGCFFVGSVVGTYLFAFLVRFLKARKKTLIYAFFIMFIAILLFLFGPYLQVWHFYTIMFILGISCGYPGIFTALAAESFGINQRATGTSFVSCLGRGSIILINAFVPWAMSLFGTPLEGILFANIFVLFLSIFALFMIRETHAKSIDYIENAN